MASIITADLAASGEGNNQCLRLYNGEFARKLAIGSNWTEICIAARVRIPATASITGSPLFYIGMCNDAKAVYDANNSFMGRFTQNLTMSYSATYNSLSALSVGALSSSLIRGGAVVDSNGSQGTALTYYLPTNRFVTVAMNIKKGATNVEWSMITPGGGSSSEQNCDVSLSELQYALEQGSASGMEAALDLASSDIFNRYQHSGTGAITIAELDEATYGYLDSVGLFWDRASPPIDIADISVAKWA
jgi:hypothetical protein